MAGRKRHRLRAASQGGAHHAQPDAVQFNPWPVDDSRIEPKPALPRSLTLGSNTTRPRATCAQSPRTPRRRSRCGSRCLPLAGARPRPREGTRPGQASPCANSPSPPIILSSSKFAQAWKLPLVCRRRCEGTRICPTLKADQRAGKPASERQIGRLFFGAEKRQCPRDAKGASRISIKPRRPPLRRDQLSRVSSHRR
jgi:hypothetical protein